MGNLAAIFAWEGLESRLKYRDRNNGMLQLGRGPTRRLKHTKVRPTMK